MTMVICGAAFRVFPDVARVLPDSRRAGLRQDAHAARAALGEGSALQRGVLNAARRTSQDEDIRGPGC